MNYFCLTWVDLIMTPIMLCMIFIVALIISTKVLKNDPLQKFFIPALSLKIIGSTLMVLIYQFYYTGGDTSAYFIDSLNVTDALTNSPTTAFKITFTDALKFDSDISRYTNKMIFFKDPSTLLVCKVAGFINLLTLSSFLPTSIVFGIIGLSGIWALLITLYKIEPALKNQFAFATLYIPSICFWGSGLIKDTLVISAFGWLIYGFYNAFILRKEYFKSTIIILISVYIITVIKIYVTISLLAALLIWFFLEYHIKIRSVFVKNISKPLVLILSVTAIFLIINKITQSNSRYGFKNIFETSKITGDYIARVSKIAGGSYYSIGDIEYSFTGFIKAAPAAVNVTLYRPYLWEVSNVLMLVSALENTLLLLFTLYVFYKTGFIRSLVIINKTPYLFACIAFIIPFAFAIGISTMNFGTLARYKLPLIPLYTSGLSYLYFLGKREKEARQNK